MFRAFTLLQTVSSLIVSCAIAATLSLLLICSHAIESDHTPHQHVLESATCAELAVTPPPTYDAEWLADLQRRTRVPRDRIERQLGTLGGGNHFIEIDRDGEQAFVAVHSGSRGIGQGICQYHQNIITSGTRKDWSGYEKAERAMRKRIKDKDAVEAADKELRAKFLEPSHPPYLEGAEAAAYYYDMIFAQVQIIVLIFFAFVQLLIARYLPTARLMRHVLLLAPLATDHSVQRLTCENMHRHHHMIVVSTAIFLSV